MPSPLDVSKRALVALLRSLGLAFGCPVTVTRDSSEQQVKGAFRSVARKVRPDKHGGSQEEFKKLSAAHDAWTSLLKSRGSVGRPRKAEGNNGEKPDIVSSVALLGGKEEKKQFSVQTQAVLLTYQGLAAALRSPWG